MPVLCDFAVVEFPNALDGTFEKPLRIGNNLNKAFSATFNTGGLHHAPAVLTMMVRGLTRGSARVGINQTRQIGRLSPSSEADRDIWRQQQFLIQTNILRNGDNTLIIGRVPDDPPHDDFEVHSIVCFFHQAS